MKIFLKSSFLKIPDFRCIEQEKEVIQQLFNKSSFITNFPVVFLQGTFLSLIHKNGRFLEYEQTKITPYSIIVLC
jgi:hypothetical protein